MRRAIAGDFAAVPGVRVVTTLDSRLPAEAIPGVEVRVIADLDGAWFDPLAAEADYTVLIAPETDGILYRIDRRDRPGRRSVARLERRGRRLRRRTSRGWPITSSPATSPRLRPGRSGAVHSDRPADWEGPIVVKPRFGRGSVDTVVVRDRPVPVVGRPGPPCRGPAVTCPASR